MADENLNDAVAGVSIESDDEAEKSDEEVVEDPPELMREPSTPAISLIIEELTLLSVKDLGEVRDSIAVLLKNKNKTQPKAYIKWCADRDKWLGMVKPKPFAIKVGELGDDVPTYQQWHQWNNPEFKTYKGDRWSLVDGVPVRKGAE